jgi:hypothetical protein
MNRYIKDYIKVYDDALDPEFCESLISDFENKTDNQISTGNSTPFVKTIEGKLLYKKFTEVDFGLFQDWNVKYGDFLKKQLMKYTDLYLNELKYPSHLRQEKYTYEAFRIKRYLPNSNDRIDEHTDATDMGLCRRYLSLFWYLNDVDDGGETLFTSINYYVKPKRGRLVVFPPNFMFPHAGRPVLSGTKYLLHSYLQFVPDNVTNFDLLSDLYPRKSGAVREKTINKE